ncbi:protein kinase [Streptomyces sp. NPDC051315]|uniref:protein kinase domain-containing protein n=1 Tax=Streptomyces sp. NPDC051315 TaxID=3365650 RepID=UPI0037BB6AB6
MTEQTPGSPDSTTSAAAALRQAGAAPLRPGDPDLVGPYVPLGVLGSGGMGRVYLARPVDSSPGLVALKVIRPEYAEDPRFRRRFEREASVHARLRTPHTPRLCGTGFRDELLWMATEYLPGLDLAEAVREDGTLGPAALWRLTAELARALAALSDAGIVHRDLKPSNVLLSVRGAHVIDFGISKAVDSSAITGTGNRVGTPAYMSPEHLRTGHSDTASDVFSLAGTLVYAATGRAPFGDGTGVDVMHRVAFEEPHPELLGEITATDPVLGSLLSACLAKDPSERPTPRALAETAGTHTATAAPDRPEPLGWPEPLGARVRARGQAYETLYRLPVTTDTPAPPADTPAPPADSPASPVDTSGSPVAAAPPGRLRRPWSRRKPLLAAAAALALCTVVAAVSVLTRQDAPASAHSPAPGTTSTTGAVPDDASLTPVPGAPAAEGGADRGATGPDGAAGEISVREPDPEPSGSATGGDRTDLPAPGASGTPAPTSPDSPSSAPAAPPWISECTHYDGSGRTRQGDSGKRVSQVQCMLTQRGYPVGDGGVDGRFGPGTDSAVRSFQHDEGLGVDGVVGRDTWAALRAVE